MKTPLKTPEVIVFDTWHVVLHVRWIGWHFARTAGRVTGGVFGPLEFWRRG